MSSPSPPPDNSMQIEQMRQAEAQRKADEEKAAAEAHKQELLQLRNNSRSAASNNVNSYFTSQGVDPSQYTSDINSYLDNVLAGISPTDENPSTYFKDAGSSVYSNLQTGARAKAQTALDKTFAPNFETQRIPFTLDDTYLDSIRAEQRASADSIVRNMLQRGVISTSGYNAAEADLDKQDAGVKTRLNEFGTTTIAGGQQKLKDIANKARQDAANLTLGSQFDPTTYSSDADRTFNEFINTLGDQIRSKVSGNLFNTTGLAAIAGAAQGAGNTAFNPNAAQGIDTTDPTVQGHSTNDDNKTTESIF